MYRVSGFGTRLTKQSGMFCGMVYELYRPESVANSNQAARSRNSTGGGQRQRWNGPAVFFYSKKTLAACARRGAPGRGGVMRGVDDTGCTPDRCDGGPQHRARIACACCAFPCCAYSVLCVPLLCIPVLRAFVLGVWCTCAAFSQIVRHPLVNVVDIAERSTTSCGAR